MRRIWTCGLALSVALALAGAPRAFGQNSNALFLSKSQGYQHSVITQKNGQPSHVDKILTKLLGSLKVKLLCTKDANLINANNLKKYKLVVFYTQGDLCQKGTLDNGAPMGPNGVADLIAWVKGGGGFMGFHCASDTFHTPAGQPVTPYLKMLGAEFRGHGAQFKATLRIVDPHHPTMVGIPQNFQIYDEIYTFKNYNRKQIHVLAMLDPGAERHNPRQRGRYNMPDYPIIWCSAVGKGRVYFDGLGHRKDVWTNPVFQKSVVNAAKWAMGQGPTDATPNFDKVVPAADVTAIETHMPGPNPSTHAPAKRKRR